MFVGMWMTPDPFTVAPDATISFAAMEMRRRRVRRLLVAEPFLWGEKLVGMVAKNDVVGAFPTNLNPFSIEVFEDTVPRPVSAIMARNVQTTSPDTPIEEAARALRTHKIGALPVLSGNRLVGIITESDIFDAFIVVTGANRGGVRITLQTNGDDGLIPELTELSRRYGMRILSLLSIDPSQPQPKDTRGLCTFRFTGGPAGAFIDEIWALGHRVLSVLR